MEQKNGKGIISLTYNINYLLRLYSQNFNTYEISFQEFVIFVKRCLYQDDKNEVFRDFSQNTEQRLIDDLELLFQEANCSLEYVDGNITQILFPRFFIDKVARAFKKLDEDMDIPFPNEITARISIPQELVEVVWDV